MLVIKMASNKYYFIILVTIFSFYFAFVRSRGILLLYRPLDITYDCASSRSLRYDLSFGMGMSDTITVIFRTLPDSDYSCEVDITTDRANKMVVVIRFPTAIGFNCEHNPEAFHVMKYESCFAICNEDELEFQDMYSNYWILFTQGRFRFQFRSNASINSDLEAYEYEVTATTARLREKTQDSCYSTVNETECWSPFSEEYYCMTSGVVCDGIKNCGTADWFDERHSECDVPIQTLGYLPIIAVMSIFICTLVALAHILRQCLPKATSFFIYHTDEDNKFCITPVFNQTKMGCYEQSEDFSKRKSLVPMNWTDSEQSESEEDEPHVFNIRNASLSKFSEISDIEKPQTPKQSSRRSLAAALTMSQRIGKRLRSVVGYYLPRSSNTSSLVDPRHRRSTSPKRRATLY